MRQAVVTGAAGFFGRHWVRFLEGRGVRVHSFSRRSGPEPQSVDALAVALQGASPDAVFHLAGTGAPSGPSEAFEVNVAYAARLFEALDRARLRERLVVLVGTAAEYGPEVPRLPVTEDVCCRPSSLYGISKLAQTQLGQAMARDGRRVLVVRPTNLLGAGMPRHLAVRQFAEQAARARRGGPRLLETGDLQVQRDFLDVEDACTRLWALARVDVPSGEIVNLGRGEPTVLADVVGTLVRLVGGDIEVRTDPGRLRANDLRAHWSSIEKLRRLIGDLPLTPLEESLRRVLAGCLDDGETA